jgi:polyhydroxyalkanoate synthase
MELIQYEPTTKEVKKDPLLIIPPWINKYYILDLRPENSFVKWLVDQGHTVFMISWVNPGKELGHLKFEDYMTEGLLQAVANIQEQTGKPELNVIGYCIGGTLLSMTLSWLELKKKPNPFKSATFLTTLLDFENAGELKLFTTPSQIEVIDAQMKHAGGVLPAHTLKTTFSLLRANDLIWSFVINNYLIGKDPFPFDLLFWNDDSTNLPAAMHSYYLKNMYRDNLLREKGKLDFAGEKLDLSKIKTPAYFLATKDDHIAPWTGCYQSMQLFTGEKIFTLAGSGHIAGVVNPPQKKKYHYWTIKNPDEKIEDVLNDTKEFDGSWWPHWQKWIDKKSPETQAARKVGKGLCPAPGTYVK